MRRELLVAEIMSRAGACGDTELVSLIGELLKEVASPRESESEQKIAKQGQKYVVCVEATQRDGKKVSHPVIGWGCLPTSTDAYKMTIGENLVELQRKTRDMKSSIEGSFPVKVVYVPVDDETIATLEQKLKSLIDNLVRLIEEVAEKKKAAYDLVHAEVEPEDISDRMIADVMRKTIYAGACINDNGEVEDRIEGRYEEERQMSPKKDDEDDSDSDDTDEDCDGDCDHCENGCY